MQVVGEATDGENAIQLAFADRPDLILLDNKMPPMNGVQVARSCGSTCLTYELSC